MAGGMTGNREPKIEESVNELHRTMDRTRFADFENWANFIARKPPIAEPKRWICGISGMQTGWKQKLDSESQN